VSYASIADFFRLGLRPAAVVQQPRAVVTVDTTADTLLLPVHGMANGDQFRVTVQGVSGTLPAPLAANVTYYAIATSDDVLQVAATHADAVAVPPVPINLTGSPTGVVGIVASAIPMIQATLDGIDDDINAALIAYGTPLPQPYPPEVIRVECHLAAFEVSATMGFLTPATPTQDSQMVTKRYEAALATLERWRKGGKLQNDTVDASPNVVENGAFGWADTPSRWSTPGGFL
jgi:Protein of unknown function (DUF1320)